MIRWDNVKLQGDNITLNHIRLKQNQVRWHEITSDYAALCGETDHSRETHNADKTKVEQTHQNNTVVIVQQ